ncbi:efflux RND transporter periplasmic adaptor subunit [Candidatus Saganbacteria bacterium]|nr:efflux RND transporter periplasmic adaptor subunit [Candidatus Saganbacteria bacterium]
MKIGIFLTIFLVIVSWLLVIAVGGCAGSKPASAKVGDFYITVAVQPDPPRVGDNTLKIKVFDAAGKAVKNAAIHFTLNMPAMGGMGAMSAHGGADLKGDTYQGPLSLPMGGTWDLRVELHIEGQPHLVADFKVTTGTKGISFISSRAEKMETNVVKLSTDEEKIIGVLTEPAKIRRLVKEIRAVGQVAYDPELFVAQQEFVGAADLKDEGLLAAAKNRLRILGMGEEQIAELEKSGTPQSSLILPEDKVWVYADFYEYEAQWLKAGLEAKIVSPASPGEEYAGRVGAIEPLLKDETRTLRARIETDDPNLSLKPKMYVDVYLKAELPGAYVAVPSEAVLDTGMRKLVYVDLGGGNYSGREVKTGPEASGYVPILEGIKAGEKVVSRANFLIDSQSKLVGGAAQEGHQH